MKEQIITLIQTQEFIIGLAVGLVFMILILFSIRVDKKKKLGLKTLLDKVQSINQNIINSQKENIEAKKKLDDLYKIFQEVNGVK